MAQCAGGHFTPREMLQQQQEDKERERGGGGEDQRDGEEVLRGAAHTHALGGSDVGWEKSYTGRAARTVGTGKASPHMERGDNGWLGTGNAQRQEVQRVLVGTCRSDIVPERADRGVAVADVLAGSCFKRWSSDPWLLAGRGCPWQSACVARRGRQAVVVRLTCEAVDVCRARGCRT